MKAAGREKRAVLLPTGKGRHGQGGRKQARCWEKVGWGKGGEGGGAGGGKAGGVHGWGWVVVWGCVKVVVVVAPMPLCLFLLIPQNETDHCHKCMDDRYMILMRHIRLTPRHLPSQNKPKSFQKEKVVCAKKYVCFMQQQQCMLKKQAWCVVVCV